MDLTRPFNHVLKLEKMNPPAWSPRPQRCRSFRGFSLAKNREVESEALSACLHVIGLAELLLLPNDHPQGYFDLETPEFVCVQSPAPCESWKMPSCLAFPFLAILLSLPFMRFSPGNTAPQGGGGHHRGAWVGP